MPLKAKARQFYWGVSTSAHQIEGDNYNDWAVWEEHNAKRLAGSANADKNYGNGRKLLPDWDLIREIAKSPQNYISGIAADSWRLWKEDIDLVKSMGLNAYRFSIEWSRIQPERNRFDDKAMSKYVAMVSYCHDNGITPFITLHHYTNPVWLAEMGGWENPKVSEIFAVYVEYVVKRMPNDQQIYYAIINEPNAYALIGWIVGIWPPAKHNYLAYRKVKRNLVLSHKRAYSIIKANNPLAQVSSAVNLVDYEPSANLYKPINRWLAKFAERYTNEWFIDQTKDSLDYLAINHYMHCVVNLGYFKNDRSEPKSDLGWFVYPQSLGNVIEEVQKYNKPVIITENGLADAQDELRPWYIAESIKSLNESIKKGYDVRGYLHWSLLDNFEWDKGYWPKFGLYSVDPSTQKRTKKRSAGLYMKIVRQQTAKDR